MTSDSGDFLRVIGQELVSILEPYGAVDLWPDMPQQIGWRACLGKARTALRKRAAQVEASAVAHLIDADGVVLGPSASVYGLLQKHGPAQPLPHPNFVSRKE